jgi:acyl-CoA synthetase (AMP-forming)/AMP-acid ligase II
VSIKESHITDLLRRNAFEQADKPAVVFEGKSVTWKELWSQVEAAAPFFAENLSGRRQEAAAILLPNSVDFIVVYLAILHSGHIALPLDPAYKKLEQEAIIQQLDAKVVVTDADFQEQVGGSGVKPVKVDDLKNKKASSPNLLRLPAGEQIASLTFTSGTTSTPKAVPNTHANHLWNIKVCSKVWDWTEKDTLLVNVPLSHMLGVVMSISGSIYHANTIYLHKWFDAVETMEALSSGNISFFTHAASAYVKLVQAPDKRFDLSKVRLCVSGAAPLPPAVWQEFKNRFGIEIRETYGSSETGRIAANRLGEPAVHGSAGRVLPEVDLKLSDKNEVLIKSPGVFPGYYHNPQATQKSLTADGYWRTGDIGELRNGYVFLKGRKQERIRRYGYTISPRDVEWAMYKHPEIKDIYVMGRQIAGEPNDELVYFLVTGLEDEEIHRYCKQNLLFAWRPDRIIRLDELPRTRSGKIRIGALKSIMQEAV